jgi:hypothetical protein
MATPTDEQLAQPGNAGTKAAMAFQGPDTNVTVTGKPRRFEWSGPPAQVPKNTPLIPPALSRGAVEMGDLEKQVMDHGLYWVRVHHHNSFGEPRPVVGPYGKLLEFDTEHELPGGAALQLVGQGSATFLFEGSDRAELEFIERAKKMGYTVEAPRMKAADRPEFQFMKKKKGFVKDSLDPALKTP